MKVFTLKKIFLLFPVLVIASIVVLSFRIQPSVQTDKNSSEKLFIVHLTLGENWDHSKSPNEQANFKEHSQNLAKLRNEKKLLIGARYADKGMMIFKAADTDEVRKMFAADPMIENKLFNIDIQEMSPFYFGCLEAK